MRNFLVIVLACLSSLPSHAGIYSFGGGCASMGAWSKAALSQADTISRVVQTLKDNPDCKGIESILPKISIANDALAKIADDGSGPATKRAERMESLPAELGSLRNFAVASPELKEDVLKLLTLKSFEGASIIAETGGKATPGAPAPAANSPESIASGLTALNTRVRRASSVGMEMLDQVLMTLPNYNRCLIGQPDQGLALLSATVKLTAAFVSSQDGIANRMSNSISHLVTYLRTSKFTSILRTTDESEFWLSMSCLIETTTQTYCAARDAQHLLAYSLKNLDLKPNVAGTVTTGNPLEGYYVLTRDIPRVSSWLQKVMFGIKPKLQSDASYKNKILSDIFNVQLDINRIQGIYAENTINYGTLTTLEQKQNFLISLIGKLLNSLGSNSENSDKMNFFALATSPILMPFKLIGKTALPEDCIPNPNKPRVLSWDEWMRKEEKFQPEFHTPDQLLTTIGQQLEVLIAGAEAAASNYFQSRLIVDMADLVTDAVTGQTHTVMGSLARIHAYLQQLEKRITSDEGGDIILAASIGDTARHIRQVLATYEEVKGTIASNIKRDITLETEQVNNLYKKIIESAYKEFNVITQRDTFLSNRVAKFIQHDYVMRIKANTRMSTHEREILLETGNDLLYRLTSVTNDNPTAIKNDLASAQVVNKRNLEGLEMLLKESLYPTIEEVGLIASGKAPSDADLRKKAMYRMYRDNYKRYYNPNRSFLENALGANWAFNEHLLMGGLSVWFYGARHPELYPMRIQNGNRLRGKDDEFGSFAQFKAKLCIQTLAFEDRKFFERVCRGSVLKSAFDVENANLPSSQITLNADYDSFMTKERKSAPVDATSVCAFQNFSRRNQVYWMTFDLYSRE